MMQASDHESPVIDTHPLHRGLILVSRMIVRYAVRIERCTIKERRIVRACDIGPNEFIEQDYPHAERFNLGDSRPQSFEASEPFVRIVTWIAAILAALVPADELQCGYSILSQLTSSVRQLVERYP